MEYVKFKFTRIFLCAQHKRSKIYKLLNWVFFICVNSEIFLRSNCIMFDEILENIEKFKVFVSEII